MAWNTHTFAIMCQLILCIHGATGICPCPRHEYNGQRVQPRGSTSVYLVIDGVRRGVPNEKTYNNLFRDWKNMTIMDVENIPLGTGLSDGAILAKTADEKGRFLISDGVKRLIINPSVYDAYHFSWEKVVILPKIALDSIPKGENIGEMPIKVPCHCPRFDLNGQLVKSSDSASVYLILDGLRCGIPNGKTFNLLFRDWKDIKTMDVSEISLGPNLTDGAVLVKNPIESSVYLVSNGVKRGISSGEAFEKYHFSWGKIVVVPKVLLDMIPLGNSIS